MSTPKKFCLSCAKRLEGLDTLSSLCDDCRRQDEQHDDPVVYSAEVISPGGLIDPFDNGESPTPYEGQDARVGEFLGKADGVLSWFENKFK
jgi:hypothetical protein